MAEFECHSKLYIIEDEIEKLFANFIRIVIFSHFCKIILCLLLTELLKFNYRASKYIFKINKI